MSARLAIELTALPDLLVLQRAPIEDSRGWFERLFCDDELAAAIGSRRVMQANRTLTRRTGMVRGLHWQQPPHAEMKLVSCLRGAIFDVAVDLRQGSPTFLKWHAETLTADNRRTLLIPEGFAHGFQALTDDCELLYLHTARFAAESQAIANAADPRIAIAWPLPIGERSARDAAAPMLAADFAGVAS